VSDTTDKIILSLAGYSGENIRDMNDLERTAEIEQALDAGGLAPPDADCVLPRRRLDVTEYGTGAPTTICPPILPYWPRPPTATRGVACRP